MKMREPDFPGQRRRMLILAWHDFKTDTPSMQKNAKAIWQESASHVGYLQLKSAQLTKKGKVTCQ